MMEKRSNKILLSVLLCAVGLAVIFVGVVYFRFISRRIFEDSTGHLEEIYGQVNRSFGDFIDRSWDLLDSSGDYLALAAEENAGAVEEYIADKQGQWGFTSFYFLSHDQSCMTPDGTRLSLELGDGWGTLAREGSVMAGVTLSDGRDVTVFAVSVPTGRYRGFDYDAIAIGYTNADLANSLNVDAFSGYANCFVIRDDGAVLLSTQEGGNVFKNYLAYLDAASDLDEEGLTGLRSDWQNGVSGLIQCQVGGVSCCILYLPVGYQDYVMLSVVPQSAVSAGFLSVQKTTIIALAVLFLLIGATVFAVILSRSKKRSLRDQTELRYRELMFDMLSNNVDDIFIMLNTEDHGVDYISPNIERLLGIPAEEARRDIRVMEKCAVDYDVVIPKAELAAIPLNGNRYWECEYMHQGTGERRWYRMTVYHMRLQEVERYVIVLSDRTQERLNNQQLQQALTAAQSANEAKSNFLSNMSHDIRTPMNAIVGFALLLEKNADQPDRVREYTRKITASSHHLLSLINDVLDMSKIESGKTSLNLDSFSLPQLLEELKIILLSQAKAKRQQLTVHVQGTPPEVIVGDKLRLNQILINLLSNAVKYTPEEGKIELLVSELPQASPQYVKLRFVVRDNGIGMSEEFQRHVFAPFSREISSVTNTIQGTGLGMAITKNLVDLMGGVIWVESQPGRGSTFTVELSFALPEKEETVRWFQQKISRMLVADDEMDVCQGIMEMMHGSGVDISCVTDGAAAVEAAVQAHRRGEGFQVILLDWKMPGMDGVEAARSIRRQIGSDVPILVLTSYDWSDIEDEARQAGINAFMPKPFFTSTFWNTIAPLFGAPAAPAAPEEAPAGQMAGHMFLVAEDNELNAEILTEMLHMEGARCELAENGRQAVDMFLRSEPGTYDMILMDVQMPVMNGYEATRAIRASGHPSAKTIPIVAMTANTFAEDVRNALDAGMDGHLGKPIDMDAVRELVGKLLDEHARAKEQRGESQP